MIYEILDHITNGNIVCYDDDFVTFRPGRKTQCCTAKGWFFCVRWEYGSYYWVYLKYLKESNLVEVADCAAEIKLLSEPDFSWWILY